MRAVAAKRSRTLPVIGATLVALCTIPAPALAHTATSTLNKETTNQRRILGKLRERLHERWNHWNWPHDGGHMWEAISPHPSHGF